MSFALMAILVSCTREKIIVQPEVTKTIKIGGLFSIPSNLAALGLDSKTAMELAIEDINAVFSKNDQPIRLAGGIEDTQLDPTLASNLLKAQAGQGINYFVGPSSSAEGDAVKAYADANQLLVISHYSTAGRLAIADDNLFRFYPSDIRKGLAIAALCKLDGIQALVPMLLR